MERRVVVTGMGAITPIGNNVETFWNNVKAGVLGIDEITKFDTTEYSAKLAAEVKDFNAKEVLGFKQAKRLSPFSQYAVAAAKEDAVWPEGNEYVPGWEIINFIMLFLMKGLFRFTMCLIIPSPNI